MQAIQLLTQNLVCLNEPFRLVFVEANDDKLFYELVLEHFQLQTNTFSPYPISFLSLGLSKSLDENIQNELLDTTGKTLVKDLVNMFNSKFPIFSDDKEFIQSECEMFV